MRHGVRTLAAVVLSAAALLPAARATAAASTGCGKTLASGRYRMVDQGASRLYGVLVPSGYRRDVPYPLILAFHGWGGDEREFLADRTVRRLAGERGYVVVAPRGLGAGDPDGRRNSWSFRGSTTGLAGSLADDGGASATGTVGAICDAAQTPNYTYPSCRGIARNTCSWTQCQVDDVAFAAALIAEVESKLCIDTARVYATGGSNGGMFTWELGQNPRTAPLIRAIAPIIGLPHRGHLDAPGTATGMPVLLVTGANDPTVPPGAWEDAHPTTTRDGDRYYYTGATAIVRRWGPANACAYTGTPATPFGPATPNAECRTYCGEDAAGWSGAAGGVRWPKVLDCRGPMAHDYDFAWSWRLVLDFFDAHGR